MRHREAATTQEERESAKKGPVSTDPALFYLPQQPPSEWEHESEGEDCSAVSEASQIWAIGFLSSLSFLRDPEGGVKAQGNLAHLDVQRDAGGEFWGGELASFIPPIHSTSVGLPRNNFELH